METLVALKLLITVMFGIDLEIPERVDCDQLRAQSETVCTACNIYHEARGETFPGQIAVASVTRNRVDSDRYPDKFCDVVWQRRQFSWTWDGKSDIAYEQKKWEEAYLIAYITVNGYHRGTSYFDDKTHGSLWYHANWANPYWSKDQEVTAEIGDHLFYSKLVRK